MSEQELKKIRGIWFKFNSLNQMSTVTLDQIEEYCIEQKIKVLKIEECDFGFNCTIPAIKIITSDNKSALLPRHKLSEIKVYQNNILPFQKAEEFWSKVDWFLPVFMNLEQIHKGFEICNLKIGYQDILNTQELQERFEHFFSTVYNLSNIIPVTVQTLSKSIAISKHVPIIKESILAFYSGMRITSIASLIPIIEDILNSMIEESPNNLDLKAKVDKCIERARNNIIFDHIQGVDWIPEEYIQLPVLKVMNERIRIIELIGNWLKNSFYEHTQNYKNISGFNRHFFAHAKSELWQNPSNFFRAMGLIQALAFIECFALKESKISIFAPDPDSRSKSFYNDVMACLNVQVIKNTLLQQLQIQNCLPFNPTASDDGWLGRSAILSSCMDEEIVKRLRDHGWQCHSFGQPIQTGEYITVKASKNDKTIGIALLYSCATDNEIYKLLEQSCDYILYQGSPYHQSSFAYGINCYVGPINAWLVPD